MIKYLTKQRKLLLDYLSAHLDQTLSAYKIASELSGKGISPSAVYRNLSYLENERQIRKIRLSGSREIYYQYIGSGDCKEKLHASCIECGKTFHINRKTEERLLKQTAKTERFRISKTHTILYGFCGECAQGRRN